MMVDVTQTVLMSADIPQSFPEPLRRALLDQSEIVNSIVSALNETKEKADSTASSSAISQQVLDELSRSISESNIMINKNVSRISVNYKRILELQRLIVNSDDDISFIKSDYVSKSVVALQEMSSPLSVAGNLLIDGKIILSPTQTGWAPSTGTNKLGGMNADESYPVSAVPTQPELVAIASGLVETRKVLGAIIEALTNSHKLIGPTPTTPTP